METMNAESNWLPNIGPYRHVWAVGNMHFKKERRTFKVVLYGARLNAGILVAQNGVAILDEDYRSIVCDDILTTAKATLHPTKEQKEAMQEILSWNWEQFTRNINCHPRCRGDIQEVLPLTH